MSELIAISALVGDRTYRIKINREDEEVVRKTLKTINQKFLEFKTQFPGKDMQDYVSMVLLWYAVEQNKGMSAEIKNENIIARLQSIEKLLDEQLNM